MRFPSICCGDPYLHLYLYTLFNWPNRTAMDSVVCRVVSFFLFSCNTSTCRTCPITATTVNISSLDRSITSQITIRVPSFTCVATSR